MKFSVSLCIFGIVLGVAYGEANDCSSEQPGNATAFDIAKMSMVGARKVLYVYEQKLDTVIPWDKFNEIANALEAGRGRYSRTAGRLVDNIKTSLLNSESNYFTATESIYNWCGESISRLQRYIYLFNDYDENRAEGQKELLMDVLDNGLEKMNESLTHINQSIYNFNELNSMSNQLELEFKSEIQKMEEEIARVRRRQWIAFIYPSVGIGLTIFNEVKTVPQLKNSLDSMEDLKNSLTGLRRHVTTAMDETKKVSDELKQGTIILGNLRCQTKTTSAFVIFNVRMRANKVLVEKAATNLIDKCRDHRRRQRLI